MPGGPLFAQRFPADVAEPPGAPSSAGRERMIEQYGSA